VYFAGLKLRITIINSYDVWTSIYRWLGFEGAYAATAVDHFMQHGEMFVGKKRKKTRHLVWLYFIGSYGSLGTNVFERKVPCQNVVILNIKFVLELVYAKE
jgi:hypothetical protein